MFLGQVQIWWIFLLPFPVCVIFVTCKSMHKSLHKLINFWKNCIGTKLREKCKILVQIWKRSIFGWHILNLCCWQIFQLNWKFPFWEISCQVQILNSWSDMWNTQIGINILHLFLNLVPKWFFTKLVNLCCDSCYNLICTKIG